MKKGIIVLLLVFSFLFSGCSIFKKENEVMLEAVVRVSSARILEENPTWVKETYRITDGALKLIELDPLVTLGNLENYIIQEIKWEKLTPEERELLRMLISMVRQDIENYFISKGYSDPLSVNVRVVNIITWIKQTAEYRL